MHQDSGEAYAVIVFPCPETVAGREEQSMNVASVRSVNGGARHPGLRAQQ
ncbi:hypothetical protein OG785_04650 [Streptomyces sp. NBC_00006]|nr:MULTISPECIES: hypothetical protein [unclassified Streptomyces]MCX4834235.1 hypothetical protein [Streptomyces sp. NBC_01016]MCX5529849.1 hypothetical protein [Streptomyces sp. NBC_00006]